MQKQGFIDVKKVFDDIKLNFNVVTKCYASEREKTSRRKRNDLISFIVGFFYVSCILILLKQEVLSSYVKTDALMLAKMR